MFKIITKLHTEDEDVYTSHCVRNQFGEKVEYMTKDKDEAAKVALSLLEKYGYADLKIIDDLPYYLVRRLGLSKEQKAAINEMWFRINEDGDLIAYYNDELLPISFVINKLGELIFSDGTSFIGARINKNGELEVMYDD